MWGYNWLEFLPIGSTYILWCYREVISTNLSPFPVATLPQCEHNEHSFLSKGRTFSTESYHMLNSTITFCHPHYHWMGLELPTKAQRGGILQGHPTWKWQIRNSRPALGIPNGGTFHHFLLLPSKGAWQDLSVLLFTLPTLKQGELEKALSMKWQSLLPALVPETLWWGYFQNLQV